MLNVFARLDSRLAGQLVGLTLIINSQTHIFHASQKMLKRIIIGIRFFRHTKNECALNKGSNPTSAKPKYWLGVGVGVGGEGGGGNDNT